MRARSTITALVVAVLATAGCAAPAAPPPPPPSPSASPSVSASGADCERVLSELTLLAADVTALTADLATDPLGALLRVGGIAARLETLTESVSDPELQSRLDAIGALLEDVLADAQTAAGSQDPLAAVDEVVAGLGEVQAALDELVAYCAA